MDILPTVPIVYEAALSAVLAVFVFTPLFIWMKRKLSRQHRLIIETTIEEGQTTRQYGFAEPSIKVRFVNSGTKSAEIQDVRLVFGKNYGLPLPAEAPPPRSHPALPVIVESGSSAIWYFPAQAASRCLKSMASPRQTKRGNARVRVVLTRNDGQEYRGPHLRLSLDQNSLWHL